MRMLSPFSNSLMMNRQRLSPNRRDFFDEVDYLMNDFFRSPVLSREMNFQVNCDISESDKYFLVQMDIPGVNKDDLKIEVNHGNLKVSGHREERQDDEQDEKILRFERSYGSFSRSFSLPENLNLESIEANYDNGVLQIAIAKLDPAPSKTVEIKSGESSFWRKLLGTKKDQTNLKDAPAS